MPRIHTFGDGKLAVYIYADDHAPPHFHVVGPDHDFQVNIATLQVMRGNYTLRAFKLAIEWAEENSAFLSAKWTQLNEQD